MLSGFSREHVSARCPLAPGGSRYCRVSAARRICLPDVKPTSLQRAIPSARGVSTSPSPRRPRAGCRNLDRLSIGIAVRLTLRPRLTLIRLALIRNPWSYGGGVSRPPCRYLYLHLLFRCLQRGSRPAFGGCLNAPLPMPPSGDIPRLRRRAYARLLSMRGRSTSELLRTLQMNGCFQANILAVPAAPLRYCLQLSPHLGALAGGLSCSSLGRGP